MRGKKRYYATLQTQASISSRRPSCSTSTSSGSYSTIECFCTFVWRLVFPCRTITRTIFCLLLILLYLLYHYKWIYITWESTKHTYEDFDPRATVVTSGQLTKNREVNTEETIKKLKHHFASLPNIYNPELTITDNEQVCSTKIPLLIHQTYATDRFPEEYRNLILGCIYSNQDFKYVLWTDEDAKQFIRDKYPTYYAMFMAYTEALQKSDSLRLFILHYYGGVYLDMDVECLRPVKTLLQKETCFFDQERQEQTQILHLTNFSMMNSVMGCRKNHPFLHHLITKLTTTKRESSILKSTGPLFMTHWYNKYNKTKGSVKLLSPEYFSPLMDSTLHLKKICEKVLKIPKRWQKMGRFIYQYHGCKELDKYDFTQNAERWLNNKTIGIHHFLHLGYILLRKRKMQHFVMNKVDRTVEVLRYTYNAHRLEELSHRCYS